MPKNAPRFRGLSQYVGSKDPKTTNVYYITGVNPSKKTYKGNLTLRLSDFFKR